MFEIVFFYIIDIIFTLFQFFVTCTMPFNSEVAKIALSCFALNIL